ncbi:hypothetical protein QBC32DRAFT_352760 [Pseudoneurospora amorphoporcata]|uniref:Uncharacterized protein n=1 Tax=Pseudoneurospora amorphoporcata TaxID=241081 RepID=A0AAN6SBW9_9PEZI|nr:hypothetical protein QBC32DRAFT_352760 [Pseudoneurospora amorphoporcata]
MSFRPHPQFLKLGVGAGRPRLGPGPGSRSRANELFSQLSSASSRFSTSASTSTPLSHAGGPRSRPRSHHSHHHENQHNRSNRSWNQQQQTRHNSTNSNSNANANPNGPNPNGPNPSQSSKANARIDRLLTRVPRFLHPYLLSLRSSPSSFIVAFLILHEITAVLPGLGFFYFFHYYDTDTDDEKEGSSSSYGKKLTDGIMGWMMEHGYSEVMATKMEGFERWFRKKGYFGFERKEDGDGKKELGVVREGETGTGDEGEGKEQVLMRKWQSGDEKYRVLVDAALAYAITKVLLPVRIIVSVQATPWFAGVLGRVRRVFGSGLRK